MTNPTPKAQGVRVYIRDGLASNTIAAKYNGTALTDQQLSDLLREAREDRHDWQRVARDLEAAQAALGNGSDGFELQRLINTINDEFYHELKRSKAASGEGEG